METNLKQIPFPRMLFCRLPLREERGQSEEEEEG